MIKPFRPAASFSEIDIEDFYVFLRKYRLTDSLRKIAQINAVLKWNDRRQLAGIPVSIYQWIDRYNKSNHDQFLHINLARLARFLILSGGNDDRQKVLEPGTRDFDTAYNMMISLKDEGASFTNDFDTSSFLGRITHWQFPLQLNERTSLGRAYMLFVELEGHDARYSLDKKMREYYSLSALEFIASGFAIWAWSNGSFDSKPIIDSKDRSKLLTDEMLRKFMQLSSGTADDYRANLRGDKYAKVAKSIELYGLDPFNIMPAILPKNHVDGDSSAYVVPHLKFLFNRATSGIFYLLADKEREIGLAKGKTVVNDFRVAFGNIYRQYVHKMLAQDNSKCTIIDLDQDFKFLSNEKRPDFAIVNGDSCILIEVKTSLMTLNSRVYYDKIKLREEVNKGSFNKALQQIKHFKEEFNAGNIADSRFEKVKKLLPVILGFEDVFVLNSVLLPMLAEADSDTCQNLQLGSIIDVEAMGSFLHRGGNINEALLNKLDDVTSSYAIHTYLANTQTGMDVHPLHSTAFENFIKSLGMP